MNRKRLIISSEMETYQQALAYAFRELRPDVEVLEAAPGDLDRLVLRVKPVFVICSHATAIVQSRAPGWVQLYVDFGASSVVSIDGKVSLMEDLDLYELLYLLKQAEDSTPSNGGSKTV